MVTLAFAGGCAKGATGPGETPDPPKVTIVAPVDGATDVITAVELQFTLEGTQTAQVTLADATGTARGAVNAEVQKAQDRLHKLEVRRAEVAEKQRALAAQQIDEADLSRALEAFAPVWDELWTSEKTRLLNLLIEQVRYHGGTDRLQIDFNFAGISTLAEEMNGAA